MAKKYKLFIPCSNVFDGIQCIEQTILKRKIIDKTMKTKRKKIKAIAIGIKVDSGSGEFIMEDRENNYLYTVESEEIINLESFECSHEIKQPETIKEFKELNGMKEKDLIKWLNENYKQ